MSCNTTITRIEPTEYIGNSLDTINGNFASLRNGINENCTTILSATNIINSLQTIANTLQTYTLGRVKAWVSFDATKDVLGNPNSLSSPRYLYTQPYNIFQVYKLEKGIYEISFAEAIFFDEPLPGESYPYGVLATTEVTQASGGLYSWAQPVTYASDYVIVQVTDGQGSPNFVDPSRVTVAII